MTETPTVPNLTRMRKKIEGQIQKLEQDIFWLKNRVRVIDLFSSWDADGNGIVTASEFRRAFEYMGYEAAPSAIDTLFRSFDANESGSLDFSELNAQLRRLSRISSLRSAQRAVQCCCSRSRSRFQGPHGQTHSHTLRGSDTRQAHSHKSSQRQRVAAGE